jgi:hypothetical protein
MSGMHPIPTTPKVTALSTAERFVLWSLRLALSPQTSSDTTREVLSRGFRASCVSEALPHFLDMTDTLNVAWYQMQRVPDIHCTCCPCIGGDEWCVIQAIAALQFRDVTHAMKQLQNVLPLTAIRRLLPRAMHVAATLGSVGWTLRCVGFEAANAPHIHADFPLPDLH